MKLSYFAKRFDLGQVAYIIWLALLFIQPFGQFVALKYLLTACLLIATVPLIMRVNIWQRLEKNWCQILALALATVVWCLMVSIASPYSVDSLHALARDLLLQALLLSHGFLLDNNTRRVHMALWAILAGFAIVSVLSGFEVGSYLMDHSLSEGMIPRSQSSYWGGYANTAGFCLPLLIAITYLKRTNIYLRVLLGTLIILGILLTVLYGSRSPLIVIIISVLALFVISRNWRALFAALLIIFTGTTWVESQRNLGYLEKYRSFAYADTYTTNHGLSARLDVWSGVLDLIEARPLLGYGYGWKKLAWAINDGGYAERWKASDPGKAAYYLGDATQASYGKVNPHNYFLQVAFEIGIPGLMLVLLFWAAVFWQGAKDLLHGASENTNVRMIILTTLLAYWLSNVANGFWVGGLANMACALVGMLIGLSLNEHSSSVMKSK